MKMTNEHHRSCRTGVDQNTHQSTDRKNDLSAINRISFCWLLCYF